MQTATIVKKRKSIWCSRPSELPIQSFRLPNWGLDIIVRKDIDKISSEWDRMAPNELFARSQYLKTLELTNPDHLNNLYVLVKKEDEMMGAVLLQSLVLNLGDSFNYDNYTTNKSFLSKIWQRIRQIAVSWITFRMMTVGNLYLTGQYGILFNSDEYNKEESFKITRDILNVLKRELCNTPYRFRGVLFKDFFDEEAPENSEKIGLNPFRIDPNMILSLRPTWQTFDDYLLDMKSKYRVRLKNAIKKFNGVESRVLSASDIHREWGRMYDLYTKILDGSGFVLAMGKEPYFLELKKQLAEHLHVVGYYLDNELIGFYTWVLDEGKMDSHFIGFEPDLNSKYQLYLNILLDLVKDGISNRATSLYYFRTALEIKSSVGAEPFEMWCYFKHSNKVLNNYVVPVAFKYFVPHQNWKQRHPFK